MPFSCLNALEKEIVTNQIKMFIFAEIIPYSMLNVVVQCIMNILQLVLIVFTVQFGNERSCDKKMIIV